MFEWRPGGNNIAVGGENGLVRIYSRYGEVIEEFNINDKVSTLNWDADGELLAITNERSPTLVLYEVSMNNIQTIDTSIGAKNSPTFVVWNPTQPLLVIGDNRGNVTLYNHRTSRKTPILGKHQKAIRTGAFAEDGNLFALGADDAVITINNIDGDTLQSLSCAGDISCIQISRVKQLDEPNINDKAEDYLSAIVKQRSLMFVKLNKLDSPANLQFQNKYGDLIMTRWFGNGNILVGFEHGHIVCISTEKSSEVSELFSIQDFKGRFSMLEISQTSGKVFVIGDNLLKIRNLYDLNELVDMIEIDSDDKGLRAVSLCDDGSLVAVSGNSGLFNVYFTKIPMIAASYQNYIAVLSSLTEITIYRDGEMQPFSVFNAKFEPSIIAVGLQHIVVVQNHRAWFYFIKRNEIILVYDHDYIMTVSKLHLNGNYVVAKLDHKIVLHLLPKAPTIDSLNNDISSISNESIDFNILPNKNNIQLHNTRRDDIEEKIFDFELSEKFLIYCTNLHYICYYSLSNECIISDYKHTCEVRQLFAESNGIRLCFIDERHDSFIYSSVDEVLIKISYSISLQHYKGCLWETFTIDRDSFVLYDDSMLHVFVTSKNTKSEQVVTKLNSTPIPFGNMPLMLSKGIIFCNTQNGRLNTILLKSHKTDTDFTNKTQVELQEMFEQSLTLKRWRNAWQICDHIKDNVAWEKFSRVALEDLNIELAIRIFRFLGDVAMVWTLEEMQYIEDRNILAANVAALLGQFDNADELFCQSHSPLSALNMRRDIQHWDRALELAKSIAPAELPLIAKEYAVQLELIGKHEEALNHYEGALNELLYTNPSDLNEQMWLCKSGIARMALRTGDLQKGVQTALEIPNRLIKRECGLILEEMKQYDEAGELYEAGQFYDRAVTSFMRSKNWIKINELIQFVRSPKIFRLYGKILMAEKKYEKAFEAYKKALDYDNMVRILLQHLNRPEEALVLVQKSRSIEGAKMVAKFFTDLGNKESAIEFLVLSQCYQEAYELAESTHCMSKYANEVEQTGNIQIFGQLAEYYSTKNLDHLMAGKFAGLAKNYSTALIHLIKASSETGTTDDLAVQLAVEFIAESEDQTLIYKLIDFLMGETDGIPRLYVRLKMYPEAAKTAIIIAQDQQSKGFYKAAHDLLFDMYKTLREQEIHIPSEMENNLQLLHSYNIIKNLIKRGENVIAARLLIRITANIRQFPLHSAQILTSAVITCNKAGLMASALKFATQLLQPSFRKKIDEKYKRKIETVVRKSERNVKDETEEKLTPCPFCNTPTAEFTLTCNQCKSNIPYCVLTGRHIVADDFTLCPSCSFPGFYSEFKRLLLLSNNDESCPMCYGKVNNVDLLDFHKMRNVDKP